MTRTEPPWMTRDGKAGVVSRPKGLSKETLQFLIDQSVRTVDADWESVDRLSTRASNILGVAISIVTGVTVVGITQKSPIPHWLFGLTSITLLASAALAVWAYAARWTQYPPDPEKMGNAIVANPEWDAEWDMFTALVRAHIQNRVRLRLRKDLTNASLYVFAVSLAILLGSMAWFLL